MGYKYKRLSFRRSWKQVLVLLVLVVGVFYTTGLAQKTVEWFTNATYRKASIVVYSNQTTKLNRIWDGLSQGFESNNMRLDSVAGRLKTVGVRYVRIDHVLDGYGTIGRRSDGTLYYDFTNLDRLVNDILSAGAKPFFSLSYMPPAISNGDVTGMPSDWGEYARIIGWFVAHYSRDFRGGIDGVVYEVWNEPDLFGGWKSYGSKNYLSLYTTAVRAAEGVRGAKPFLIGGPATTGFYPAWAKDFYSKTRGVRKDFFSWHRYSYRVDDFVNDVKQAHKIIAPLTSKTQKVFITEWGPDSERGEVYDSRLAGIHMIAVATALEDTAVDMMMAFEVQDGKGGSQWHGGWGMFTNPEYGTVLAKPRWKAYSMLQELRGQKVKLVGEGSFVRALGAVDEDGTIRVLVSNYDYRWKHSEVFPVTVVNLVNGEYTVSERYFSGRQVSVPVSVVDGRLKREYSLDPNDAVLIEIRKR